MRIFPMPTNFLVSKQPALRCVTGEPHFSDPSNPAAGFFTRLRVAERLVIQHGAPLAFGDGAREWMMNCVPLNLRTGFPKKPSHA